MAKWLSKYEQGGLVLKQKTKDNYGKKPNPNNVQASVGPDFVGQGYDITGRNYSPAWGGQFQNGGNLSEKVLVHDPQDYEGGHMYALKKTVTPYKTNQKIKKYTKAATNPEDIDFLHNYRHTSGVNNKNATAVPYEGDRHWNIDRFITDPAFGTGYTKLQSDDDSMEAERRNVLADMFKYQMFQHPEQSRGKSFRQAKRFVRNEIDPRVNGPFFQNYMRNESVKPAPITDITSYTRDNPFYDAWLSMQEGEESDANREYRKNPWDDAKVEEVAKDYLKNTKKLSRKETKEQIKKWKAESKSMIDDYYKPSNTPQTGGEPIKEYAMGGGIPGAVGFTYARIAGAAPSNGKYAKKTKASAQNGKVLSPNADDRATLVFNTSDPAFQHVRANSFVPFDRKDFEGIKQDMARYVDSPLYMQRLSKSVPDSETAKDIQQKRLDNLLSIKLNPKSVNQGTEYNMITNRVNLGSSDFINDPIVTHEISHGMIPNLAVSYGKQNILSKGLNVVKDLFQSSEQFTDSELEKINRPLSGRITAPNFDYMMARKEEHYAPQGSKASAKTAANETYGDLNGIRTLLYKNGITNDFGQDLTPELWEKAMKNPIIHNEPTMQRMRLRFKDDDIIKMNNEVAYNNANNRSFDQAKNGSVIKDDMGQWAHPGEITEIGSNDITMEGVDYPVLGISDTGDTQMMYPDQDYKFDGEKVTEFPMMKDGGWLDKYKAQDGKSLAPYGSLQGDLPEVVVTSTKPSKWGNMKFAPYDPSKNPESISQWNPKPGEREAMAAAEQARRDEENSFYNNKHIKALRNSAFADWKPYALAGGVTALPAIGSALGLGYTSAALAAPLVNVGGAGVSTGQILSALFAAQAAKGYKDETYPLVAEAIKNPTKENIINATNSFGWNTLNALPFVAEATPGAKYVANEIGSAINASKAYGTLSKASKLNPWAETLAGQPQRQIFGNNAYQSFLKYGPTTQPEVSAAEQLAQWNKLVKEASPVTITRTGENMQVAGTASFDSRGMRVGTDYPFAYFSEGSPWYGPNRSASMAKTLGQERRIVPKQGSNLDFYPAGESSVVVNPGELSKEAIQSYAGRRRVLSPSGEAFNPEAFDVYEPHWWKGYQKEAPPPINKNKIAGSVIEGDRKIFYNELGDEVGSIESFPDIDAQRNINWGPLNENIPEPRTIANPDYTDVGNRYLQNNDPFAPPAKTSLQDIPISGGSTTKGPKEQMGFPNPLDFIDEITPRLDPIKLLGVQGDIMDLSPLNLIPGYGKKLAGKNQTFRKFGNSIQDVIERQALSPKGGSKFRMGKDQIVKEGNWAARGEPNENYSGVFEATFDLNNPAANLSASGSANRNGVLMMDKAGNRLPDIPLTEPGMSFNRRLPFSTRYVPIDKQKLINNEFQFATMAPRLQSLAEKYGLGLGAATLMGTGAVDTYNKYTIDPVINMAKKLELEKLGLNFKASKDTSSKKKQNGGWLNKYK